MGEQEKRWDDVDLWNAWVGGFGRGAEYADRRDPEKRGHERDIMEAEASARRYLDAKVKIREGEGAE